MYCVYGNSSKYKHGGSLCGGGPLLEARHMDKFDCDNLVGLSAFGQELDLRRGRHFCQSFNVEIF